jgi:hypothetical protein
MFDRGDSSLECLIEETAALTFKAAVSSQTFKPAVSSIKHSRLLSPLSNIQGCCLLYQTFKAAVSSIKHSRWLSPLSNIQACCLLYQTFKPAVMFDRGDSHLECLIEETAALNV